MSVDVLRECLTPILRRHGVRRAALFGSTARGEDGPESDLDLLVEFEPGRTLLDLVGFRNAIRDELEREADVVTEASLHPALRTQIVEERIEIL